MNKFRVIFYRAKRDGHALDDGINVWTAIWNVPLDFWKKGYKERINAWWKGCYSHVEIWWPDVKGMFICNPKQKPFQWCIHGQMFTSTMRGDAKGTVIRPASEVLKNPSRWDYIEIEVDEAVLEMAKEGARFQAKTNKGYDFLLISSFFIPIRIHDKKKAICSTRVQRFCRWCGVFDKFHIWSPRRLSRKLVKKGYKIKSLV